MANASEKRALPEIVISPAIIKDVQRQYKLSKSDAMQIVATYAGALYERCQNRLPKKYWNNLDTQAFYVLLDNSVLSQRDASVYINELREYETWLAQTCFTYDQRITIDSLPTLLQIAFAKQTLGAFETRLHTQLKTYKLGQCLLLQDILMVAIAHVTEHSMPTTSSTKIPMDQRFITTVVEATVNALASIPITEHVRLVPHKRLAMIAKYVDALINRIHKRRKPVDQPRKPEMKWVKKEEAKINEEEKKKNEDVPEVEVQDGAAEVHLKDGVVIKDELTAKAHIVEPEPPKLTSMSETAPPPTTPTTTPTPTLNIRVRPPPAPRRRRTRRDYADVETDESSTDAFDDDDDDESSEFNSSDESDDDYRPRRRRRVREAISDALRRQIRETRRKNRPQRGSY